MKNVTRPEPAWPQLRAATPAWWQLVRSSTGTIILGFYQDGIIAWDYPLTNMMMFPFRHQCTLSHKHSIFDVSWEDVVALEERCWKHRSRYSTVYIRTHASQSVHFRLETSQLQSLRPALDHILNHRFSIREPAGRVQYTLLLVIGLILTFPTVATAIVGEMNFRLACMVATTIPIAALCVGVAIAGFMRVARHHTLSGWIDLVSTPSFLCRPFPPLRLRSPLSSRWLGILLKALGTLYVLAVTCAMADTGPLVGPFDSISPKDHNEVRALRTWIILYLPGPFLLYLGHLIDGSKKRPSTEDNRPPVLFLRPFANDLSTSLQPTTFFAYLTGVRAVSSIGFITGLSAPSYGRTSPFEVMSSLHFGRMLRMLFCLGAGTTEESLASYFSRIGPFLAIGKPGELFRPAGATREYCDDDEWQDNVLQKLRMASIVVVQAAGSSGVRWELHAIRTNVNPRRVLIVLDEFRGDLDGYDRLRDAFVSAFDRELPSSGVITEDCRFVWFDEHWNPIVQNVQYRPMSHWPLCGDACDLVSTLAPFVSTVEGGGDRRANCENPCWNSVSERLKAAIYSVCVIMLPVVVVFGFRIFKAGPKADVQSPRSTSIIQVRGELRSSVGKQDGH